MILTYAVSTNDAETWRHILPASLRAGTSVEYMRIVERQTGWSGRLFAVEEDGRPVAAYPYFLRPIDDSPAGSESPVRFDTTTPEYSGPIWLDPERKPGEVHLHFPELFAAHCREQGIIAEFAHLDPWVQPELLDSRNVIPNREIVYVDLTWSEEDVWMKSLSSDARRQTKQGYKAGVQTRRAESADDIVEFHRLYAMTMERLQAKQAYRYPLDYFMAFFELLPDNSFYVLAEIEGRVVAGGLFLQDDREIRWHLSAADRDFSRVRPVNVYLHDTIRASLGDRWKRMILGGAYTDGDGVFRFKANFSRLRANFYTYQRIHDEVAFDELVARWYRRYPGAGPRSDFFPAYRSLPSYEASDPASTGPT